MNDSTALTLQEEIPTHGAAQQKRGGFMCYLNRGDCQADLVLMDCRDFQLIGIDGQWLQARQRVTQGLSSPGLLLGSTVFSLNTFISPPGLGENKTADLSSEGL